MFQTYFGPPVAEIVGFLDKLTSIRFDLVTQLMRDGIAAGELQPADPEFLALTFCCLMDQPINIFARRAKPKRSLTSQLADAIVDLFLHGVGNRRRQRS